MSTVEISIPGFRLGRGQNDRMCWQAKAAKVRMERTRIWTALWLRHGRARQAIKRNRTPDSVELDFGAASAGQALRVELGPPPYVVTITRVSPSSVGLDGHDNLSSSAKATVDELASWLCVNDGDKRLVQWRYAQERGPWAVLVRIASAEAANG